MTDYLGPYLLGPNDTPENGIYTGDARELAEAIPDESVDLILCDPLYDSMEHYSSIDAIATRVLKQDTSALVACSIPRLPDVVASMPSLRFKWILGGFMPGRRNLYYRLMSKWFPYLWLVKGNGQPRTVTFDMSVVTVWGSRLPDATDSHFHAWQKPVDWLGLYLDRFTSEGTIVLDPCAGGGSVPAVCKMLGRRYLAFEIDAATAERARERVRNTQPPLFVPEPEQGSFDFAAQGGQP